MHVSTRSRKFGRPARQDEPFAGVALLDLHLRPTAGKEKGVRVVEVPSSEQGALLDIARGAGRYPRIRFIIVADNLDLPLRGTLASELMAGLTGGTGPSGWPSNALLYVGASPSSTITFDSVVSRFGIVLTTGDLTDEQFARTLAEMLKVDTVPADYLTQAQSFARSRGGFTIRNADLFARMTAE